jgi:NAD(P)-dependent dehydrogenase (short-subunit alcohol dehydrogenase family)
MSTPKVILVTGVSSGFGAMTVRALADAKHVAGLMDAVSKKLGELAPDDADPSEVARQIVKVVDTPEGSRPFRVYVDPADDGAEDVFRVGDRVRQWFYQRIGLSDLLSVSRSGSLHR